jgi:hypothetical protein
MPLMIFTLWLTLKVGKGSSRVVLIVFMVFFGFLAWVENLVEEGSIIGSLFIRRLVITPGLLTGLYFEYFSDNPVFLWSHSILSSFVEQPYSLPPAFLIGFEYFGSDVTSANANLWADGFANAGLGGPLVVSLLAGLFFRFADWVAVGRSTLGFLAWLAPSFALVNSAFLTSVLTHGLLATVVLVLTIPRRFCGSD